MPKCHNIQLQTEVHIEVIITKSKDEIDFLHYDSVPEADECIVIIATEDLLQIFGVWMLHSQLHHISFINSVLFMDKSTLSVSPGICSTSSCCKPQPERWPV